MVGCLLEVAIKHGGDLVIFRGRLRRCVNTGLARLVLEAPHHISTDKSGIAVISCQSAGEPRKWAQAPIMTALSVQSAGDGA